MGKERKGEHESVESGRDRRCREGELRNQMERGVMGGCDGWLLVTVTYPAAANARRGRFPLQPGKAPGA